MSLLHPHGSPPPALQTAFSMDPAISERSVYRKMIPSAARRLCRRFERAQRRDPHVQSVEPPGAETREAAADIHHQIARRLQAQRRGSGILHECRIVVIWDGGCDYYVGLRANAHFYILCHDPVSLELEMRSVLLGGGPDGNDDDSFRRQCLFRFVPCKIFQQNSLVLTLPIRQKTKSANRRFCSSQSPKPGLVASMGKDSGDYALLHGKLIPYASDNACPPAQAGLLPDAIDRLDTCAVSTDKIGQAEFPQLLSGPIQRLRRLPA